MVVASCSFASRGVLNSNVFTEFWVASAKRDGLSHFLCFSRSHLGHIEGSYIRCPPLTHTKASKLAHYLKQPRDRQRHLIPAIPMILLASVAASPPAACCGVATATQPEPSRFPAAPAFSSHDNLLPCPSPIGGTPPPQSLPNDQISTSPHSNVTSKNETGDNLHLGTALLEPARPAWIQSLRPIKRYLKLREVG